MAADTARGISEGVNGTVANVDALAATVASLGGSSERPPVDTAAYTTAAGGLVNWAAEQYVERQKLAALRRATADSKPVVAEPAALFTEAAEIAAVVPRAPLADLVAERRDALDDRPTEANLHRLIESAAAIVAAAEDSRNSLFDLELGIEKEVDALRFRVFQESRDLTADELDRRTKLRACQAEIRDAHLELAHVTLVRLDNSDQVRSLNARIGEVNRGLADDLQGLTDLEELAGKIQEVTDKLAQVVRKISERAV